jgi:protein TonB
LVTGLAGSLPDAPVHTAPPGTAAGSPRPVVPDARDATAEGGGKATAGDPSGKTVSWPPLGDSAGIRDRIQRGIAYPAMARTMGWEGKVVVAFLILPDGSVRNIRVVQRSGHEILDRVAVEAVRNASPFPRPPAEAEVITPVVYRLNGAP